MVKKLFSILMVVCMVLTLIPNVAKADDEKVVITDIKVTVQTPTVGETANKNYSIVTTPETTDCMDLESFEWWYIAEDDFTGIVSRDRWHKMSDGDKFQEGYYYGPKLNFKLRNGYELATDVTGSINGYKHSGVTNPIGINPGYAFLVTEFVPTQSITSVEVSVDHPIYGATKDEMSVTLVTPTKGAYIYNVNWVKISADKYTGTNEDLWTQLESDEEFTTGYYYGANIAVKTESDYYFDKTLEGKVNGQNSITTYGEVRKSATLANLFITFEPFKLIKDVKATVATPKIGEEVDFNASIVTDPENSATVIEGATWIRIAEKDYTGSEEDMWELVEEGEKFEEGYYYMVGVVMQVDDAYYPDDTTTGTINGGEHNDMFGDFLIGKIDEDYYHNYLFLATLYGPLTVEKDVVPSTGDNSPIFLMLSVMALSGAAIAVVDKKRKK